MKKNILFAVSGGIAAYKAPLIVRLLVKNGFDVKVIMTESAKKFVSPLSLEVVSQNSVSTEIFGGISDNSIDHIELADWADIFIVAPATANTISKFANGIADNLMTTVFLATTAPTFIAPGMNVHMWENSVICHNVEILKKRGVNFIGPEKGELACGYDGYGRMSEPHDIVDILKLFLKKDNNSFFYDKTIVITTGATREYLDPVRFISNPATGKTGVALAKAAYAIGAKVILIYDHIETNVPKFIQSVKVKGNKGMYEAVLDLFKKADVMIMSAAVSDWTFENQFKIKMKKNNLGKYWNLQLTKTYDILQTISQKRNSNHEYRNKLIVGFAAETPVETELKTLALQKLQTKGCDYIIANNISSDRGGFATDENEVLIVSKDMTTHKIPMTTKDKLAFEILRFLDLKERNNIK